MNLKLTRTKNLHSTIGELLVDNVFECYILEDKDRGLNSTMSLPQIMSKKVPKETAIPTGTYNIVKYFSPGHNEYLPLLEHVPGFVGIEIHIGNYIKDTDGCLLPGTDKGTDANGNDTVWHSTIATGKLHTKIFDVLKAGGKVTIEII